jgi:hypothetical protein
MPCRLSDNMGSFCPDCEKIFPVFNNVMRAGSTPDASGRRRNLLQAAASNVTGTYTILLVYDKALLGSTIYFADISKAVYNSSYSPVWAGSSDPSTVEKFISSLSDQQFAVRRVDASGSTQ